MGWTKNQIILLIALIISFLALVVSIISLFQSNSVNVDLNEFKGNLVEVAKLISNNATIENIGGVECVIFKSGGKICSGNP